ncbi:MAG TPA: uracil-DNA glycosylase family protein [Stellaceae bacterium]|nr:uracil-DNA glycosylase family protein [Stellaceae bacterium]
MMAAEFDALVAARKACRVCVERSPGKLRSCAEFAFDPEVVSHWEQWLGHRNPKLLAVGQDFGNVAYFVRHRGRDDPRNHTNRNLHRLLHEAGIAVGDPGRRDCTARVFLTNAILCLKEGGMNGAIRAGWIDNCTERHLSPLVRLLRPPVVVGMGNAGWRAVRRVFGLGDTPQRIAQAAGSCWLAANGTRVFAVGHPGPLGLINRPWPQQLADWRRIGAALSIGAEGFARPHAEGYDDR